MQYRLSIAMQQTTHRFYGLVVAFFVALCVLCVVPGAASAHELESDGTISGVLHFEPNDDPVSGAQTNFVIFIDDTTGQFLLANCACSVLILQHGAPIVSPLVRNKQSFPGGAITFPHAGTYELVITGKPAQGATFQPFTLTYPVYVSQGPTGAPSVGMLALLGFCFGISGAATVVCIYGYGHNKRQKE
jgi:hypothetical protein